MELIGDLSWDGSDELKIVAFDFDGVIFDGESVAVEIGEKFGLGVKFVKRFLNF